MNTPNNQTKLVKADGSKVKMKVLRDLEYDDKIHKEGSIIEVSEGDVVELEKKFVGYIPFSGERTENEAAKEMKREGFIQRAVRA